MSYEKFRSYLDGLFQVGRLITIPNQTKGTMRCRVQIGEDGGAVMVALPPGGEFTFVIGTQNITVHLDGIDPIAQSAAGGRQGIELRDHKPHHKPI